jgi:MoxR-like ATPase
MRGINVSETSVHKFQSDLPDYFRMKQPILVTGPVGIGKSSIIKEFTEERGLGFSVVYLSQMTSADVRGIPVPEPGIRRMDWYPPACFPLVPSKALLSSLYQKGLKEALDRINSYILNKDDTPEYIFGLKGAIREGIRNCDINTPLESIRELLDLSKDNLYLNDLLLDIELDLQNTYLMGEGKTRELELKFGTKGGVLLLDELLAVTDQAVQIAANQLLLEGLLGDFELMEGWVVWAAGNRGEHGMLSNSNAATLDRVTHINLMCNSEEWLKWAKAKGFSYLIIRFLESNHLCFHTGKTREEIGQNIVFATPRSWEAVDKFIKEMGSIEKATGAIEGRLGRDVCSEFITFATEAENVPSVSELMQCQDDELIKAKLKEITRMPSAWGLLSKLEGYIEANKATYGDKAKDHKEEIFALANKAMHILNLACELKEENPRAMRYIPWHEAAGGLVDYVSDWIKKDLRSSALYRGAGIKASDPLAQLMQQPALKLWYERAGKQERELLKELRSK